MKGTEPTVEEIRRKLQEAGAREFAVLERSLVADTRKGVRAAVETARRRIEAEQAERARLEGLYAYERSLAEERGGHVVVGLDEVGRGPLAGPLAVGAVVLPDTPRIEGLNDSKQVKPEARERMAVQVKSCAVAWTVQYVAADVIDAVGMTASLVTAFRRALAAIEEAGVHLRTWGFWTATRCIWTTARSTSSRGTVAARRSPPPPSSRRRIATPSCAAWRRSILPTGSKPTRAMPAPSTSKPSGAMASRPCIA